MTTDTRTGADIVGTSLARAGATHAFGVPGGEVLGLMQGLDNAGINFALVRHENAGGFFAEGLWHSAGSLPILVATLGPGVANAVNVVANAMQDRVPLIFLTGCVDAAEAETYTHQVFDHQAMMRPIVKGSFRLSHGAVGAVMEKAIALALSGQPGPVHIDVPISVAEALADEAPVAAYPRDLAGLPDASALEAAKQALARGKTPIMVAGVDAVNEGSGGAITAFCNAHSIPLITTYKAKGLMDERDPLCLGGAGLSPRADKVLMPLMEQADVILLAGYDPIEMRIGWRDPWGPETTVIDITPVLRTHGMHRADHLLKGSITATLAGLEHVLPEGRWTGDAIATAKRDLTATYAAPSDWGAHQVFHTLRNILPEDTIVTADSGAHRILASQIWKCYEPRGMLQSSALCTMACAMPLAGGAKMGAPDRTVLAFVGDGGLEMGAGDLASLRDHGLNIIVCVLVDESLTLIEMKQRASQRPNLGVDFGGSDFVSLAKAFGGVGVEVESVDALKQAAEEAQYRDCFTIIAAKIGRRAYDGAF